MSSASVGWPEVRAALREVLASRGFQLKGDTYSVGGAMYVPGENDLAAAIFEFKEGALHAAETMYKGSWVEGLPPQFAVMERSATLEPEFELLEQMRIHPVLFTVEGDCVAFDDIDQVLGVLGA